MATKRSTPPPPPTDEEERIAARSLPHNLEAERSVLGAIMVNHAVYEVVAGIVTAADFYRRGHRLVFESIERLMAQPNGIVDLVMLRDDMVKAKTIDDAGGPAYVSSFLDGIPHSLNAEYYARIILDASRQRDLIRLGNQLLTRAYDREQSADELLAFADTEIVQMQTGRHSGGLLSLRATVPQALDRIEWRHEHRGTVTGVPTGFQVVDELTMGWQPGNFSLIAARPSIGKSTFVTQSGLHAARMIKPGTERYYQVAVFTLEMSREQTEDRLISSMTQIPATRITNGHIMSHEWAAMTQAIGELAECGLHIDDSGLRTVADIRRECRMLQNHYGLDLVIVDYLQLVTSLVSRKGSTENERISDTSRSFKLLARELKVPVVALSQLSRPNESRYDPEPKLTDLRGSGALEQDADDVFFLHRSDHRQSGYTALIAGKQRNGPTGTVALTLDRDVLTFRSGGEEPAAPQKTEAEKHAEKTKAIIRNNARKKATA